MSENWIENGAKIYANALLHRVYSTMPQSAVEAIDEGRPIREDDDLLTKLHLCRNFIFAREFAKDNITQYHSYLVYAKNCKDHIPQRIGGIILEAAVAMFLISVFGIYAAQVFNDTIVKAICAILLMVVFVMAVFSIGQLTKASDEELQYAQSELDYHLRVVDCITNSLQYRSMSIVIGHAYYELDIISELIELAERENITDIDTLVKRYNGPEWTQSL